MHARKLAVALALAVVPGIAVARSMIRHRQDSPKTFALTGRPLGGATAARATAAHLTGSRIAAVGDAALVIDADSGAMILTDRAGLEVATLPVGRDAGLLAYDGVSRLAYVADRRGDQIKVIKVGATLSLLQTWRTPIEPYGVALTPDRKTLLVSTIAARVLVGLDVATGVERWRTALGREPRGLAISPDGSRALVSYLVTGTIDRIDLAGTRRAEHVAISTRAPNQRCRGCEPSADSFARGAFAVTYLGDDQAVVPYQLATPVQQRAGRENTGSYGGGFEPPLTHQLAFVGWRHGAPHQVTAQIAQHQPRALAWDGVHDALYVAGLGTDTILQVTNASKVGIGEGLSVNLNSPTRCGPDGLAVTDRGDLLVWCAFSRSVRRVGLVDATGALAVEATQAGGPTLVASALSEPQHDGMVLFHQSTSAISRGGAMACASCHPDQRADGLSWRIEQHELQTPLLAGRVAGTHPFKWDGGDADLATSLTATMRRLGGQGLANDQTAALAAYLEALPTVRSPTRDPSAVARGKHLFDDVAGCRSCHDGPAFTDQDRHKLSGTLAESDTPSLLGVHASAPYFHDGSAATLEAVLRERGAVHGMADSTELSDRQVADLTAFLETL